MPTRVAVNGFGRIGRSFVRSAYERGVDVEIVAINDVADPATLAHLFAYDSVYGRFAPEVSCDGAVIAFDGREIRVLGERDPSDLPWAELGVDVVIEATGRFRTRGDAERHLRAGASKVILSAPSKGAEPVDANVVLGVNFHEVYDAAAHHIITMASCTTNCLAPVAKILHEAVGIGHGQMTTVHAYTADQSLLDGPHKDLRRARAAAINLIPTSTGAARAVGLVIPELEGRLNGIAVRVPTPTGSLVDLTIEAERATTVEEIDAAFRAGADSGHMTGILAYSEAPIVSSDIVKSPYSSIYDAPLMSVMNETQVKVVSWYDNEWGYATRLVELAAQVLEPAHAPLSAQGAAVS